MQALNTAGTLGDSVLRQLGIWWPRLLQDAWFADRARCRWEQLRADVLSTSTLNAWIDAQAEVLQEAQQRNFELWPILGVYVDWNQFIGDTYAEEVDYLKNWLETRTAWLDANLPGSCQ